MQNSHSVQVSVVTVNYGTADNIFLLWQSLKEHVTLNFEFIIVDNASPNGDLEKLEAFFASEKQVHVIGLQQNLGFGGGYREGVRFVTGNYIAIVNPDIQVEAGCFETLLAVIEVNEKVGLLAPRLLNPDGSMQQNARRFPSPWVMFGRRLFGKFSWAYDSDKSWYDVSQTQPIAVDWVQGSFMFMRTQFFKVDLGGFDERFFLFLEDTDLCRRVWMSGKKVWLVPLARARHGVDRLSGGNFFQAVRKKTFWIHVSSAFKYFFKYFGQSRPVIK